MSFKTPSCKNFILIIIFLALAFPSALQAQLLGLSPSQSETEPKTEQYPSDSLGRRTPRGTVDGYIKAMAEQNYDRAAQYMDLSQSQQRTAKKKKIVMSFQRMLDLGGNFIPPTLISNKPGGRIDDDLENDVDNVGTVTIKGETIDLYVENTGSKNNPPVWRFTRETINDVIALNDDSNILVDEILPASLKERRLWGVPVGHWLSIVVILLVSYLVAYGFIALLGMIVVRFWKNEKRENAAGIIEAFQLPLRLYLTVRLFVAVSLYVGISIIIRQMFSNITVTVGIIAILILLWRLTDFLSTYSQERMTLRKRVSAVSVILFIKRMAKTAIVVIGIIVILGAIGYDVTAWVAALGIGGIALALGAQKTVENFVGSVTLIADQPIRVGDFCKVGDITGTVESIGMRSTRLRTGARTVVTIPNGNFASTSIENFAHRDRYLFNPALEFRLESTPAQLRYLLVEIRAMMYAHPNVNPEPARIRLTGITTSAYKLDVWAYIEAPGFDNYLEVQEDLYLRILDIVAASGTDFAYPSQTLYMARDKGIDEVKTEETGKVVEKWKENNNVQLPSFSPERKEELKGTIRYPQEGSVIKPAEEKKEE